MGAPSQHRCFSNLRAMTRGCLQIPDRAQEGQFRPDARREGAPHWWYGATEQRGRWSKMDFLGDGRNLKTPPRHLNAVQELLGHSSQAMTERYAHLTTDVCRDAVHVLDRFQA